MIWADKRPVFHMIRADKKPVFHMIRAETKHIFLKVWAEKKPSFRQWTTSCCTTTSTSACSRGFVNTNPAANSPKGCFTKTPRRVLLPGLSDCNMISRASANNPPAKHPRANICERPTTKLAQAHVHRQVIHLMHGNSSTCRDSLAAPTKHSAEHSHLP